MSGPRKPKQPTPASRLSMERPSQPAAPSRALSREAAELAGAKRVERLTVDLPPELHRRLKAHVARAGTSIKEFAIAALIERLDDEGAE